MKHLCRFLLSFLIFSYTTIDQLQAQNPDFSWAKQASGTSFSTGNDIAVDNKGNTYVTGRFNNEVTFGDITLSSSGSNNIYVVKYDALGRVLWARQAGGENSAVSSAMSPDGTVANEITVDESGNIYITGSFTGTPSFGGVRLVSEGSNDIYLAKYDTEGTLQWARRAGGANSDIANDIAVDASGNIYITGYFSDVASFGNVYLNTTEAAIYIVKYNTHGVAQWGQQVRGTSPDMGTGIAVDRSGNAYVTGAFTGTAIFNSTTLSSSGGYDAFLAKYSTSGSLQWVQKAGGTDYQFGNGVAVDGSGNAYITGNFSGVMTFGNTTTLNGLSTSSIDIYLAKYNAGGTIQWAQKAGVSGNGNGNKIAIDGLGNVYLTNDFSGEVSIGNTIISGAQNKGNLLVARFDPSGSLVWTQQAVVSSSGLAVDRNGNAFVTGRFSGTTSLGKNTLIASQSAMFVAKIGAGVPTSSGGSSCGAGTVTLTATGGSPGNYRWYTSPTGGTAIANATGDTFTTPHLTATTSYYVAITSGSFESERVAATATIYSLPSVNAGEDESTSSNEDPYTLSGFSPAGGTWSGLGVSSTGVFNPGEAGVGRHALTYTVIQNGCSSSSTKAINVTAALVPEIVWANQTKSSSSSTEKDALAITRDGNENIYITGYFNGAITINNTTLTSSGDRDIFIAKYNRSGALQWAQKAGGTGTDVGKGIAVDASGNIYVTGTFSGVSTFGSVSVTSKNNSSDVFIAKFNTDGELRWVQAGGSSNTDDSNGIAVDGVGNAYITGVYYKSATFGSSTLTSSGDFGIYTVKYNSSGAVLWARSAGGPFGLNTSRGIAVDKQGNAFITGDFSGNFYIQNVGLTSISNSSDSFIAKYNSNGTLQWARRGGGSGLDMGNSVATDIEGNAYITGSFSGTSTFSHITLTSNNNSSDVFIAKYNPSGSLLWVKQGGGNIADEGKAVAVSESGFVFITGLFYNTANFGNISLASNGSGDIFTAKYSPSGTLQWAQKVGGTGADIANGIATDGSENAFITGSFTGNVPFGTTNLTSGGGRDIYLAKIGTGTPIAPTVTGGSSCGAGTVTLNATGGSPGNYRWYASPTGGAAIANATGETFTTPHLTATTSYYVAIISGSFESERVAAIATVKELPGAPNVSENIAYCQGAAATPLVATGSNLKWYTSASGGTPSIVAPTPSTASTGTMDYYVSQTVGGCESPRAKLQVTVNAMPSKPSVTVSGPLTFCEGGVITLTAPASSAYLWSTGATTRSIDVSSTGSYTVTIKNATSCESVNSDPITVTVTARPSAPAATTSITYCQGATATALAATGLNLKWYTTASGSTALSSTPIPNTATVGTSEYYVSQTLNGCESPRTKVTVTVNPAPIAPNVTSPISYCQDAAATPLVATGSNLKWYTSATGGTPSTVAPTPSTASTGTIDHYVSQTVGGCESPRAKITITINNLPAAPAVANVSRCGTGSVTLVAAGAPAGGGYRWYATATGGTVVFNSDSYTTPELTNTTSYYVSVVNSVGCESSRTKVTATINSLPTVSIAVISGNTSFCPGGEGPTLDANITSGASTAFQWFINGEKIEGSTSRSYKASRPGEYTVKVSQNNCSQISAPLLVSHISPVSNNTISGPQTLCSGQSSGQITGSTPNGGNGVYSYRWESSISSASSGFSLAAGISAQQNYNPGSISQTTWFRRRVDSGGCSFYSEPIKVEISYPLGQIGKVQGETNICANQTKLSYSVNSVTNASSYTWTVPAGYSIVSGQGTPAIEVNAGSANGQITVTANSSCGTPRVSVIDIIVSDIPNANAGPNQSLCIATGIISLTGFSPTGGVWSGKGVSANGDFNTFTAGVGTHTLNYSVTVGSCTTTASKIITVTQAPTVNFAPFDQVCSTTSEVKLTGGQPAGGTYSGPGVTDGVFNAVIAGVGSHTITYTYTSGGCTAIATQEITVSTCTGIEESELAAALQLFPNPTRDKLQIILPLPSSTVIELRLLNIKGQLVSTQKFRSISKEFSHQLSLGGLPRGVYLLQLITDDEIITKRVLVE